MVQPSLFSIKLPSTIDLCFRFSPDTRFCVHPLPPPPSWLTISISAVENYERALPAKPTFPWQLVIFAAAQVKIRTAAFRLQNFISYSQLHFLAGNVFCQTVALLILQVQREWEGRGSYFSGVGEQCAIFSCVFWCEYSRTDIARGQK
jgi:hypothetical protein